MNRDFNKWLLGFRDSIATWKYYTDFEKVCRNVERIKDELNILNGLIGKKDIEKEFRRIKSLGYENFKLKNGQVVYEVEGEKLFKIKAPEGTEIEIRDTDI